MPDTTSESVPAESDIVALIEEEAAAIEANPDAPITAATTVTRGNSRSKVLQIRLNPEELGQLEQLADSRGLPTSTVAREAILRHVFPQTAHAIAAARLVDEFARFLDQFAPAAPR